MLLDHQYFVVVSVMVERCCEVDGTFDDVVLLLLLCYLSIKLCKIQGRCACLLVTCVCVFLCSCARVFSVCCARIVCV